MASYRKSKNLLSNRDEYSKHYGSFRGVDFSSDHTQVLDNRFAYLVNMYKDYQSSQGQAVETIPGFRRRVQGLSGKVFGIHPFSFKEGESIKKVVLIHSGTRLYLWDDYERNAEPTELFNEMNERKSVSFIMNNRIFLIDGKNYICYDGVRINCVENMAYVPTTYINIIPSGVNADAGGEYEQRNILSPYFINTFECDGETSNFQLSEKWCEGIENASAYSSSAGGVIGYEIKAFDAATGSFTLANAPEKNAVLTVKAQKWTSMFSRIDSEDFEETVSFESGDSIKDKIHLSTKNIQRIKLVWNGNTTYKIVETGNDDTGYYFRLEIGEGESSGVTEIKVIGEKKSESLASHNRTAIRGKDIITKCTIAAMFDNRVFLSGNPDYPNYIFWCGINSTENPDPSYFGIMNYQRDGISPITGMIPVADALMVLKNDTQQDGSVYYHKPQLTGGEIFAKSYPYTPGLNGIGCLGACVNFLDDPVFVSRMGVEAVGQLSVRYERALEHRSSLIDAKLLNLSEEALKDAILEEWNGYLLLLVDNKIFMADSRQRYTHESGVMQYEWYYLEDVCIYENSWAECVYAKIEKNVLSEEITVEGGYPLCEHPSKIGEVVNAESNVDSDGNPIARELMDSNGTFLGYYTVDKTEGKAYYCVAKGGRINGTKQSTTAIKSIDGNIFFGSENGVICSFNFDQRDAEGMIPYEFYHFDGKAIICGAATKMDCCGIPHLTKNTVKKSTVIKTKSRDSSVVKVMVRTNDSTFEQIARINTNRIDFESLDFSDFSLITDSETIFSVKEKEKRWVEKQYYVFSDEYQKPFSLFYISYRYNIAGRIKK